MDRTQFCLKLSVIGFSDVQILLEQYLIKECKTICISTNTTDVKKLMSILLVVIPQRHRQEIAT